MVRGQLAGVLFSWSPGGWAKFMMLVVSAYLLREPCHWSAGTCFPPINYN